MKPYRFIKLTTLMLAMFFAWPLVASELATPAQNDKVFPLQNPEKYLRRQGPLPSAEDQAIALEQYERQLATQTPSNLLEKPKSWWSKTSGEKAAAFISGDWTVIPNATPGALNNVSFVRFPNANIITTATANVRIVGDDTGRDYGTAIFTIPPRSSPQYSMQDLLRLAGGTTFDPSDLNVTLYVRTSHYFTGFQHVYYNSSTDFFENMSVCSYYNENSYAGLMSGLVNTHTSLLSERFPSIITVHNENPFSLAVRLRVHESQTGRFIGILTFTAPGNSTFVFSSDEIQAAINFTPRPNDYHLNLIFDGDPSNPPKALLSHIVTNLRVFGSVLNLTTICSIDD